jgi:ABC-type multidrug transport system ATPase subunit
MRQMLSFARALLADAAILLVDEPTRSLDPRAADRIRAFLSDELAGRLDKTILWATHDLGEAADHADEIAVISRGRIRLCAPAGSVAPGGRTALRQAYEQAVGKSEAEP